MKYLYLAFVLLVGCGSNPVKTVLVEQPNGDYKLFIYGADRKLVCEEHPIQFVSQGDAVSPVVLECDHSRKISDLADDHWQPTN